MAKAVQGNLQTVDTGDFILNATQISLTGQDSIDESITFPGVDPTTDTVIGCVFLGGFTGLSGNLIMVPAIITKGVVTVRVMSMETGTIAAGQKIRITVLRNENLIPSALAV